jgi:hypothetical protein
MNNEERLNLKRLLDESNCEDNTKTIQKLKHSVLIRDDIRKIENLKISNSEMKTKEIYSFIDLCKNECRFLYDNYTDIFNKLVVDELDLTIMTKLLTILKLIEDKKMDQHEGSVMVGKILKELYVDSALKRTKKLDNENEQEKIELIEPKKISWKEYKLMEPTLRADPPKSLS